MKATTRFGGAFGNHKVVLPVIHVTGPDQSLRNVQIARDAQTDGVFLINHGMTSETLLEIYRQVVAMFPDFWIGLNCLDLAPADVFAKIPPTVAGVWVDNALIDEGRTSQPQAERVRAAQRAANWHGLYFGGVAFKYQRTVDNLQAAVSIARNYTDVVTTSGPGTGKAVDVEKIRTMKEALGDHPLAIASGITPGNVRCYLPYADCFLVATGISRDFDELDDELTRYLVEEVRSHKS